MARTQVTCEVVWRVTVEQLDGRGGEHRVVLGDFDTERDADQCLADEGFTRSRWGGSWEQHRTYQIAGVSRVLIELSVD